MRRERLSMGMDAETRDAQERELRNAEVRFELVDALERGGTFIAQICRALGVDADARTLLVTYLVTLCQQAKLPTAKIVFEFHQDGVIDRLAGELETDAV